MSKSENNSPSHSNSQKKNLWLLIRFWNLSYMYICKQKNQVLPLIFHISLLHEYKGITFNVQMKYKNQMVVINLFAHYLETKHQLKPVQNVFIYFSTMTLWPWQAPGSTECSDSSLNL